MTRISTKNPVITLINVFTVEPANLPRRRTELNRCGFVRFAPEALSDR